MNERYPIQRQPERLELVLSGLKHVLYRWSREGSIGDAQSQKLPYLLLHGWLDHARAFDAIADELATRAEVWALDFRGHGDSEWIGKGGYYHFADYLRDLHDLFDQVPELAAGCVVVGHSMGGAIATYAAATFPSAIRYVVSLEGWAATALQPEDMPTRVLKWLNDLQRVASGPRYWSSYDQALVRLALIYPDFEAAAIERYASTALVQDSQGWRMRYDPLHLTSSPQPFLSAVFIAFASRVTAPVLLICGEQSPMSGIGDHDIDRRIAAFAGPRQMVRVAGAAHMLHFTHPQVVTAAIVKWQETLAKAAADAPVG